MDPRKGVSGFNGGLVGREKCRRPPLRTSKGLWHRQGAQPRPRLLTLAGEGEVHEEQVQRDDDGRDEEPGDAQGAIVGVVAHDVAVGGEAHERDDREGDAER